MNQRPVKLLLGLVLSPDAKALHLAPYIALHIVAGGRHPEGHFEQPVKKALGLALAKALPGAAEDIGVVGGDDKDAALAVEEIPGRLQQLHRPGRRQQVQAIHKQNNLVLPLLKLPGKAPHQLLRGIRRVPVQKAPHHILADGAVPGNGAADKGGQIGQQRLGLLCGTAFAAEEAHQPLPHQPGQLLAGAALGELLGVQPQQVIAIVLLQPVIQHP